MSTTLTAGDIAIIGFNAVSSAPATLDELTFVLLKDITSGTVIKFTDNGWQSNNTFRTTEGIYTWTAPSNQTAGTVVQISIPSGGGNPDFSSSGDQILAYQDDTGSPVFLYALNNSGSDWLTSGSPTAATSYIPQNLSNGTTAIALVYSTNNRNAYYDTTKAGTLTSGTKEQLLASISNKANWTGANGRVTLSTVVPASFTVAADTTPPTANIVDVTPDPRNTNAGVVTVDFDEDVSGVDITDFTLTRDGAPVTLSGVSVTQVSAKKYTLDLSGVTTTDGSYNLVLNANSSIKDSANNVIATNASDTWTIDTTLPTADIVDISPDPRNAAVGIVTVNFTEDVTGVDITDFTLTKDSAPVSLSGSVTQVTAKQYTLDLTSFTNTAGSYVLTLNTANIKDFANNPLAASANDSWSFVTAPTADIIDVTPDPRNTAVGVVTVDFSQEVSNVDITDFVLTRNNAGVPLTGITVTKSVADPTQYTLNLTNVTNTDGTYILTVNPSDIKDAANNLLAGSVSDTWVVDKTAPTADIIDVTPDPRNTNAGVVTVDFAEDVTGVDIADFTLTRDAANVPLSSLSVTQVTAKQYTLDLSTVTTTSGNYVLSLNAATSGIKDLTNNAFAVNATDAWVTDSTAPTVDIVDITPDPRNTAVGAVTLNFSENVTGVDIADFSLTRDSVNVPLSGSVTQVNPKQYTLNLTNFSATSGNYELKLNASGSGIQDAVGNAITVDGSDSWVTDATAPTADIVDITPDPRNNAVGVVTVDFTEDVTGVNITDFKLTRNGTNVPLSGSVTQVTAKQYTLDLSSVSATSGTYVLSLNAANSGIKDATNNLFATSVTDSWVTDTTGLSADIIDVTPDPRNSAVGTVNINFNSSVTGVDIADFALTRDNTPVSISNLSVAGSGNQYTLNLSSVTAAPGTYALTLNAANSGIQDSLNNTLSTNATDTWITETTAPTVDIVDITPDPRNTAVGAVTLNFTENVTGVDIADFTLTKGGVAVPLSGSVTQVNPKQYTLNLTNFTATSGNYELKLNAAGSGIQDAVGNAITVDGSDSWVTDATAPTADIVDITPDPRNNAVGVVTVDFNEDVTGVNLADFRLTRNGTNVPLTGSVTQVTPRQYTLDLTSVSANSGTYVLSLNAANSGIKDATNNLFATSVTDSWVTDTTGLSADIIDVTPDPRNSAVGTVNINFNSSVTGVDIADFALTRDNTPVDISSLSVAGSANQYTLDLSTVTTTAGNYILTLNATGSGILDSLNNSLSANVSDAWVFDNTAPTFSSFNPADDATNVPVTNNLSVTFNEAIQKGTGNILIKKVSDGSVVQTIDVTTAAATVSGSTLTINPPANLDITTDYSVEIASGAIKDLAGNDFAGISNNTDWTFTTAATVVSPGGGSTGGGSTGGGSTGGGSTGGGSTGGGSTGGGSTGGGSTGGGSTGGGSTGGTTDTPDSTDSGSDNPPTNTPTPTVPTVHASFQPNVTTDTLAGEDTDDFLLGTVEANEMSGLGGQDFLVGLEANDNLFGNDGDDVMFGNQGADYMDGGNGKDILFAGKEDDAVKGGADDDVLIGDIGNDRLAGDSGNDILFGNLGEDCLDGSEGDDQLFGGQGNDTLIGGLGNDILRGDLGDDLLTGGVGGDRFDFRLGDGINVITDFTDLQDIIGLQGGLTFEQLTIAQVGNDTQITTGELSITLKGVSSSTIGAADFALV